MTISLKQLALSAIGATLVSLSSAASAGVVDFTGMTNYQNFTQAGMAMTATTVWEYPNPDMAHMDSGIATFALLNGADFNLLSVELLAVGGGGAARFTGFNNGVQSGVVDYSGSGVFSFGAAFQGIDQFRVSVPGSHFTFDNVTFANAVPEPSTMLLSGIALLGMAQVARRKRKAA